MGSCSETQLCASLRPAHLLAVDPDGLPYPSHGAPLRLAQHPISCPPFASLAAPATCPPSEPCKLSCASTWAGRQQPFPTHHPTFTPPPELPLMELLRKLLPSLPSCMECVGGPALTDPASLPALPAPAFSDRQSYSTRQRSPHPVETERRPFLVVRR